MKEMNCWLYSWQELPLALFPAVYFSQYLKSPVTLCNIRPCFPRLPILRPPARLLACVSFPPNSRPSIKVHQVNLNLTPDSLRSTHLVSFLNRATLLPLWAFLLSNFYPNPFRICRIQCLLVCQCKFILLSGDFK